MREWISIQKELPPDDKWFLGFHSEDKYHPTDYPSTIGICRNYKSSKCEFHWFSDYHLINSFDITHWQPLPKPPDEGEIEFNKIIQDMNQQMIDKLNDGFRRNFPGCYEESKESPK